MFYKIIDTINLIKEKKPLILCVTNYVTMDFMANILLSMGASPLMISSKNEVSEMVNLASAVNINIGTLDDYFICLADDTIQKAKQLKKRVVLDPVGAGASKLRTETSIKFMSNVDIVCGNASEILALAQIQNITRGVDNNSDIKTVTTHAMKLATKLNNIIAISNQQDFITNGEVQKYVNYGSNMMQIVTGMGCALNSVIAAFISVLDDKMQATEYAMIYYGLIGELSAINVRGPGEFRTRFIDNMYNCDKNLLEEIYVKGK